MKKYVLILTFLIPLLFISCENFSWFDDIKSDLEVDSTTLFRFYDFEETAYEEGGALEGQDAVIENISFAFGSEINNKDFPSQPFEERKVGYHLGGWKWYRVPEDDSITEVPETITVDSYGLVQSVKVTPQASDFVAHWSPNLDTKYTVRHWFQNTNLDEYNLDDSLTTELEGTTDTNTNATSLEIIGFEALSFTQVNIDGDGSGVVDIYYNRKYVKVTVINGYNSPVDYCGYYGQKIEDLIIPDMTSVGLEISSWKITYESGSIEYIQHDAGIYYPYDDAILEAQWTEINYPMIYVLQPDTPSVSTADWISGFEPEQSFTVSTGITLPANDKLTRKGYTFVGWYEDSECTSPASSWTSGKLGTQKIYAKWNIENYTISYNDNAPGAGSVVSDKPLVANYTVEDDVSLHALTYSAYNFKGWYKALDFSGTAIVSWSAGTFAENLTLNAKWEKLPEYILSVTLQPPVYITASAEEIDLKANFDGSTKINVSCASGFTKYQWFFDGQLISGATANVASIDVSVLSAGWYEIMIIVKDDSGIVSSGSMRVEIKRTINAGGNS